MLCLKMVISGPHEFVSIMEWKITLQYDAMIAKRGESRNSFIAGPSTINQRIQRDSGEMSFNAFVT